MSGRRGWGTHPDASTVTSTALAVVLLGAVLLVGLAAWLVPWQPVPGGAPDPVPASEVFSAAEIDRAETFARTARLLTWASLSISLLVASVLGFTRLGRPLVGRLRGPWWVRVALGTGLVLLIGRVVTLPLALLLRNHLVDYGLTDQPLPGWLRDVAVGFLVGWLATSVVLLVLVGCARSWRRHWPLVAGALLAGLTMLASFGYPLLVEPLFNRFEPLPDGSLRAGVLRLADVQGVAVGDVLVADASRRTTTLNAYVSGYGGTRRVVLYDTLVDDVPESQVLSVVSHELAHARHDDVLVGSLLGATGAFLAPGLLTLVLAGVQRRRRDRTDLGQPAAVPVVLALVAWASLLASPVQSTVSRQIETRADVDALTATADPDSFVALQRQLALRSLADPTPPALAHFWWGSHPSTLQRIAQAER